MSTFVVFFGGFQSTERDMVLWLASARQQRPDVTFTAYPYPAHAGSSDSAAVHGFGKKLDDVKQSVETSGADKIYIVGHSSGCAIANELNARVHGDHKNITLCDLDGFTAHAGQRKGCTFKPWSSFGKQPGQKCFYWAADKEQYPAQYATTKWALHFSLVNTSATDLINGANYKHIGYVGCGTNLCWLQ